ncbi:predicted protein [Histoplasma capsulatum G186AR]|uniref:Uncharacterized protein n=1 Tax=Ajellomyces capsulatus (strain G186AR / H82 / ATCC MYA-2454 / RMSCC 2432) TaxID=447093 RepID=C0NEP9_AJECG|nr:uncharacterized protein HCBG_01365 [Histoplasma capsulatum G186AR]EEH09720.1 predicted protein [Histoplasma capsulatum G186AR]
MNHKYELTKSRTSYSRTDILTPRNQLGISLFFIIYLSVAYSRRLESPLLEPLGGNDSPTRSPYGPTLLPFKIIVKLWEIIVLSPTKVGCISTLARRNAWYRGVNRERLNPPRNAVHPCFRWTLWETSLSEESPQKSYFTSSSVAEIPPITRSLRPQTSHPPETQHNIYDLHWLCFDRLQCLQRVKSWIAVRGHAAAVDN